MGILAADTAADLVALEHVYTVAIAAWKHRFSSNGQTPPFVVTVQKEQISSLSERGTKLIEQIFPGVEPSVCDRVAVFVVLAVNSSVTSISKNGVPVMDIRTRREFNAKLVCGFASVAVSIFAWQTDAQSGHFRLGIPREHLERLVDLMQFVDAQDQADLTHKEKAKREQALRIVLKDVTCVYAFLAPHVTKVPGPFAGDFAWPLQVANTPTPGHLALPHGSPQPQDSPDFGT